MPLHAREGGCPRSRIGVGVQNRWPRDTALGQHRLPDQDGRQVCTFALMNFPADDFLATDVHDQVEVKNMPATGPGIQVMSQVQTSQGALAL